MATWKDAALDEEVIKKDGSVAFTGDQSMGNFKLTNLLGNLFKTATELTIATGVITVTQALHTVDTESDAASDDLDTINGGTTINLIFIKPANDARTVVVKHNTGNIWIQGKADISLDDISDGLLLVWNVTDSKWIVPSPTHGPSHENGGADEISVAALSGLLADDQHVLDAEVQAIKLDDFTAPDDNTDLDASAAKHGLMPKADKTKLDAVEAAADVTDATNVAAAGAVMDADFTAADEVMVGTGAGTHGQVTLAASQFLAKKAAGAATNVTAAEALAIIFSVALPENLSLTLDDALSADGKWCATESETGTAGETLVFGDCVYFKAADSRWWHTDADAEATAKPKVGFVILAAGTGGNATKILLRGKIRADNKFPTLTIGAPAFIGTAVGEIQVAAPSGAADIVRVVGHGNTANELAVNISPVWIKIAA